MVRVLVGRSIAKTTMAITTPSGVRYTLYSSPAQFEHGDVARFGMIEREGLKAITNVLGPGLKTLAFTHTIASQDYQQSIEAWVKPLTNLAKSGTRVRFVGGSTGYEQGIWWWIKDLKVSVLQRAKNNLASRVELSWSLEEAGPVVTPSIVKTIPKPKPPAPVTKKAATRTHRVVPGDTLWGIAARYLHNPLRWPEIFNLNRALIKNPHWIFPGQVFKLPAA